MKLKQSFFSFDQGLIRETNIIPPKEKLKFNTVLNLRVCPICVMGWSYEIAVFLHEKPGLSMFHVFCPGNTKFVRRTHQQAVIPVFLYDQHPKSSTPKIKKSSKNNLRPKFVRSSFGVRPGQELSPEKINKQNSQPEKKRAIKQNKAEKLKLKAETQKSAPPKKNMAKVCLALVREVNPARNIYNRKIK